MCWGWEHWWAVFLNYFECVSLDFYQTKRQEKSRKSQRLIPPIENNIRQPKISMLIKKFHRKNNENFMEFIFCLLNFFDLVLNDHIRVNIFSGLLYVLINSRVYSTLISTYPCCLLSCQFHLVFDPHFKAKCNCL